MSEVTGAIAVLAGWIKLTGQRRPRYKQFAERDAPR
jgi:hypothetical protein